MAYGIACGAWVLLMYMAQAHSSSSRTFKQAMVVEIIRFFVAFTPLICLTLVRIFGR